ncbi:MAG TPA: hypothetical protein VFY28_01395, partial [Candidatus Paceibacterota bacterium]|nr:hypothetical protein [Candidatus Paceibacterota bacterium]
KQKAAELKDIEERITELEKAQSPEKIKLAQDKQKVITDLKAKKDNLTVLAGMVTGATTFIDTDVAAFNQQITSINSVLTKLGVEEFFDSIAYDDRPKLEARSVRIKTEVAQIVQAIETAQGELATFEAGITDHAKLLDRKAELEAAIALINSKRERLNKDLAALAIANTERTALLNVLLETVVLQKLKYEEIITTFSAQKAEVLSDLSFGAKIQFDADQFLQMAEDVMDKRKVEVSDKNGDSIFAPLFALVKQIVEGDESKIPEIVTEVERLNQEYRDKLKNSHAITIGDFYAFLYRDYFSVVPTVEYKKTALSKLSLGQKATVLIKIYLAQGDKPIIIDSHDDHLDNEFIMDELVRAIRQAKTYRQVILASNNGNVVINSDAEQIIIANREDGKISYTSGSIEEPTIRDRAVKVLEGGSTAFRQRQQKYRLGSS